MKRLSNDVTIDNSNEFSLFANDKQSISSDHKDMFFLFNSEDVIRDIAEARVMGYCDMIQN